MTSASQQRQGPTARGGDADVPSDASQVLLQLVSSLFPCQSHLTDRIEAASKEFGLLPAEVAALLLLSVRRSTVSGVGKAAGIRQNGASILVDRLVSRHLVKRRRKASDRRVVEVEMTDSGRSLADSLFPDVEEQVRLFLAPLCSEEQKQFLSFMQRLGAA